MTTPAQPAEHAKARRQIITGAMLVMGACLFGGLAVVLLMVLGQRSFAPVVAAIVGVAVIAGVVIQVAAVRKLRQRAAPK